MICTLGRGCDTSPSRGLLLGREGAATTAKAGLGTADVRFSLGVGRASGNRRGASHWLSPVAQTAVRRSGAGRPALTASILERSGCLLTG